MPRIVEDTDAKHRTNVPKGISFFTKLLCPSRYCRLLEPSARAPPSGRVRFRVNERAARVALWLNQNFLTGEEMEATEQGTLAVAFASLRTNR